MIKDIKYNGFSETPSDYECPDGDLATVTGLVPEDEALRPVMEPVLLFTLPEGYKVVFVHENTGYKHYIIRHDYTTEDPYVSHSDFYWIDEPQQLPAEYTLEDFDQLHTGHRATLLCQLYNKDIYDYSTIGNTIVLLVADGAHYFLWKGATDGYKNLGTHFPELDLNFGLQSEQLNTIDNFFTVIDLDPEELDYGELSDINKKAFTEQVLPKVNKFIADESVGKGKFIFPFLVRYAYRLYDQQLTMHSAPVLMLCASDLPIYCTINTYVQVDRTCNAYLIGMVHELDYLVTNGAQKTVLESDWSDIVKSVDIFITKPLYTYDQNGKIEYFKTTTTDPLADYSISKYTGSSYYQKVKFQSVLDGRYPHDHQYVEIPKKDSVIEDIQNAGSFYLLKSIELKDLALARQKIEIADDYLQTLTSREAMTDDYDSHDQLIPQYAFSYNSRLNLANIKKNLFVGALTDALFCHSYTATDNMPCKIYYFIKQDNKEIIVSGGTATISKTTPQLYLYYPNTNAYKAVMIFNNQYRYEVELKKHDMLNGVYFFEDWNGINSSSHDTTLSPDPDPVETADRSVTLSNKLYTSEVNNPFLFLAKGVQTIGISAIAGIRPIGRALSPSQYGQYTFYVFTEDGVWALKVNTEGYLEAPTFVTPDVVNGDTKSITQLDKVVLFASARGIMQLSGSECTCISDILNSDTPFLPFGESSADDILPGLRNIIDEETIASLKVVPFRTFIQQCRMLYDYTHQRLFVYNPEHPYAYVYSLKSKEWGMVRCAITSTVSDPPAATALLHITVTAEIEGHEETVEKEAFVDYSQDAAEEDEQPVSGLVITRPLKLDMRDILKTVDTVIQRGVFTRGHIKSIVYGSRDLQHWQLIASTTDHYLRGFRGTPYKYFRLALPFSLKKGESLFGCTVQFTPRYNNKPR